MKFKSTLVTAAVAVLLPLAAQAQNIAVVNGKAVPKARLTTLLQQAGRAGQPVAPEMESRARDEVVLREIFAQEAEKQGIARGDDYKSQMELARQTVLIRELFNSYQKKAQPSDAEARAEYDKVKAQQSGTEYKARHILVEKEDDAKKLIAEIKAGAKFEDVAKKNSKDTGSAENGGELDYAKPESYVPEVGQAMAKLTKGAMTETPVKSQFGWHIIKLEDSREAQFPAFDEVKPQLIQRITQMKLQEYQEKLRSSAKTDYKFSAQAPQQH